jgi:hypothetical protein
MQWLSGVYGQVFNKRHELTGHVFQGRFHSPLVETEPHFLECSRYDVLNPARAGLCDHPLKWRWSSLRATLGLEPRPFFLDAERLLGNFGGDLETARARYLGFVEQGLRACRLKAAA